MLVIEFVQFYPFPVGMIGYQNASIKHAGLLLKNEHFTRHLFDWFVRLLQINYFH